MNNKLKDFLAVKDDFQLGHLLTEQAHPKSVQLSTCAVNDLASAIDMLREVDLEIFIALKNNLSNIYSLHQELVNLLARGGRIFLCGCGATGRLSLALETLWRQREDSEQVISFMAGGDIALIKSIEDFEDHATFGARQLRELGFRDGDVLLASTEGGETPFVIGAVEEACRISSSRSYFLYCNPDELLKSIERSNRVLENNQIRKINLTTGPMAVSGSTRMQASTVLMAAIGFALLYELSDEEDLQKHIEGYEEFYTKSSFDFLIEPIVQESKAYQNGEYLYYETDSSLGISVLTDTTERSPTFSLHPFENFHDQERSPSYCYLLMEGDDDVQSAWQSLLGRAPRALDWDEYIDRVCLDRLWGHDISQKVKEYRSSLKNSVFEIKNSSDSIKYGFRGSCHNFSVKDKHPLIVHLMLKMMVNIHSTLVMGRLGRYQDNVMIWVKPSNYKLIDRTIRYVQMLLNNKGQKSSYDQVATTVFEVMDLDLADRPVVLESYNRLLNPSG